MTDVETLALLFESKTLPKKEWTHQAHIAVAFYELHRSEDFSQALAGLRKKIADYNVSAGTLNTDNSGYHETLTVFWLKTVHAYATTSPAPTIDETYHRFLRELPALPAFPALFYSRELLFSKTARAQWVEPDLLPLSELKSMIHRHMEHHYSLSDREFETQFEKAALDPALFTHEAHLRLAWVHLSNYGELQAIENITGQLRQYVNHLGAADKYNDTLTVAAIKAVKHFMDKQKTATFYDFITAHPSLKYNFKGLIGQHYGFDIFNSTQAKAAYIAPDLAEFT
jgi:cell division protein ZapA (FtsZ GTPase activity inhibitor)